MKNHLYKFYIGVDVSKAMLDVASSKDDSLLRLPNDQDGIQLLIKELPSKKQTLIVLEASGGYEKKVANFLRQKKFNVAVVNAKRVRDFAKASGKLAKTDAIDARVIMRFGQAFNPQPQALSSPEDEKRLQSLNRRAQLVRMIVLEKQHAEQSTELYKKAIDKHIRFLQKELDRIEASLKEQFKQDNVLQDKLSRLDEIQGVGEVTAMNILIHMPELGQLTAKEVSALTGVAPFNKDSGTKTGKRATWGGRSRVRAALYMAILSAKKSNPMIKRFYDKLIERGKLKKVAIVACMRKLLIIMNAILRDHSVWQPN